MLIKIDKRIGLIQSIRTSKLKMIIRYLGALRGAAQHQVAYFDSDNVSGNVSGNIIDMLQ